MRLQLLRCILDPVTTWQALRRFVKRGSATSFDVAYRQARVERFPDEVVYRHYGHTPATSPDQRERDPH